MYPLTRNTPLLPIKPSTIDVSKTVPISKFSAGGSYQRYNSLVGIVIAISGNILISFALNIQRYAHIKLHDVEKRRLKNSSADELTTIRIISHIRNYGQSGDEDNELGQNTQSQRLTSPEYSDQHNSPDITYLRSPYWWGGIFLMGIGEVGNFLAYGFAPASIVSPLGVVALISNCIIAPILLKEKFRLRDFWGVAVAIAGAVTVVISANQQEQTLGPHEIVEAITRIEFEIYVVITVSILGVLIWASPKYGSKIILIDLGIGGLLGGYTALSTKGISSMLSSTFWRTLTTPITFVLLIVLAGTAVMQVKYINKALQQYDSTQVIPVQFVTFTLSVIVGSSILYRDLEKTTTESVVKFICGCSLTFFGVWLITSGRPSNVDGLDIALSCDQLLERQINLSVMDEEVRRMSCSIPRSEGNDNDSIKSTNTTSSCANSNDQSKRLSWSHVFTNWQPKSTAIASQNSHTPSELSEESPLLSQKSDYLEQLPQNLRLTNPGLVSSPSLGQISNLTHNPSQQATTPLLTPVAYPHTLPTKNPSQSWNLERPVASNRDILYRVINGPLI